MEHESFEFTNPNTVRSVVSTFAGANPMHFHAADGSGYDFITEQTIKLDKINPQVSPNLKPKPKPKPNPNSNPKPNPNPNQVRRLCAAAANGDTETIRELVNEGTDVNSGDYDHRTPLHLAASEGLLPVVSYQP